MRRLVFSACALLSLTARHAHAQEPRDSAQRLGAVVTIGTRRHDRTSTKSPVPIDVISAEAIAGTGLVETWQILQRLVPSINAPHVPLGDDNFRPITMRGLAPDQVLVLVNGKRRHTAAVIKSNPALSGSSPVDFGVIPSSAIERIEILRDGAAAQYGSDAIAGVINIVLKSGPRQDARVSFSQAYSSEGGRDFRDGDLVTVDATHGWLSSRGASLVVSGEFRDRARTNRAYPDERTQYFAGDPRNENPAVISSHQGDGDARDAGFILNGSLPLRTSLELYLFGGLNARDSRSSGLFRRASQPGTVRSIYPDGFRPDLRNDIRDISSVSGARGTSAGWNWDLSSSLGRNSVRSTVLNSNNVSLGNASPTNFYAGRSRFTQWTSNLNLTRQLLPRWTEDLNVAVGAEFRTERFEIVQGEPDSYRDGGVRILDGPMAGRLAPVGAQGNSGYRPEDEVDARRSSVAGFLDLEADLTRRLQLTVAGRAEHYSDFGTTSVGRIAARFEPFAGIALRGAWGTGFRAPSLVQSHYSNTAGAFRFINGVNTPRTVWTLPVNSPAAKVLGATPLRPETSVNSSSGIVLDIPGAPTVTFDYYAVDVDDRIVVSGIFDDTTVSRLLEENGLRGIDAGRYFTNAIDTRTRGVDVVVTKDFRFQSDGALRLNAGLNSTKTRVTRVTPTPPALSQFNSVLFSRVERGKIEVGQPNRTILVTLDYEKGPVGVNVHNQRFGRAWLLEATNPDNDQTVSPKWITDLRLAWRFAPQLQAVIGAHNLFDVYPDEWHDFDQGVAGNLSVGGILRYPGGISPFGMNGRMIYLQLSHR